MSEQELDVLEAAILTGPLPAPTTALLLVRALREQAAHAGRLAEALEPFAAAGRRLEGRELVADEAPLWEQDTEGLTVGDLRRARDVLEGREAE